MAQHCVYHFYAGPKDCNPKIWRRFEIYEYRREPAERMPKVLFREYQEQGSRVIDIS